MTPVAVLALAPVAGLTGLLVVTAGTAGGAENLPTGCAGGGTATTVAGVTLTAEQIGNAQTITATTASRKLPATAAIVALTAAYTESMLINTSVETDHDSEGLFQQRISEYGKTVADDPVLATDAFLDRLIAVPGWQRQAADVDAQQVQRSDYPARYTTNVPLAQDLVGELWPSAAAVSTAPAGARAPMAVCPGAGGAATTTGAGNVAGTITIPAGLIITGSPAGRRAVAFALSQLGKPYVYGAAGPDSWDCSGLTMAAWATAGVALPHWTVTQATAGTPEPTDLSTAVGGDLVFIPGSDGTPAAPGHVGMIIGYTDTTSAPGTADSTGSRLTPAGPGGRTTYLVQAPMTGLPVEITDTRAWTGQIVAVRHIH